MRRYLPDSFTILLVLTVVLASQLPVRGEGIEWMSIATSLAIALLFFLHGARLSREVVVAGMLHWRLHGTIFIVTFGIFPLLGLLISALLPPGIPPAFHTGLIFLSVLPSTVQSSIAFTSIAGGNVPAAICSASASNIGGMFLTPLLVALMLSAGGGGGGFSFSAMGQIFLQLLLPFIVGQLLQPYIGDWVRARKKLLMPVDRGSILMVVYLAFSEAVVQGVWSHIDLADFAVIFAADSVLLTLALLITTFGSRALGFSKADEITITFCGSKKSLASGVPMAGAIFAGQSVGAIVLPLMIFHQIQLMACAVIAQRYARAHQREEADAIAAIKAG